MANNVTPTGLTPNSFKYLLEDAGFFIEDFDYSSIETIEDFEQALLTAMDSPNSLGATKGGGEFAAVGETRQVELDGLHTDIVGGSVMDKITVTLTANLSEFTPANLQRILASTDATTTGAMTEIRQRIRPSTADYIPRLSWIGGIKGGGYAIIELFNALNVDGATITFADKGEASVPVTFKAHQSDLADSKYAPYKIIFFGSDN